jgi:HrpA-like RNA helicase
MMQAMGALGGGEEVTPLGQHMTAMPVDPRVAKMLIHGALLRCTSPILTIAAAMAHNRSIFFSPPDKRQDAQVTPLCSNTASNATR